MKPASIDGWMGKTSRRWLAQHAADASRIIEVGVWKGRSTLTMARATRGRIWAVDHWQGTPDDAAQHDRLYTEASDRGADAIYDEFRRNLASFIEDGRVTPVRMSSVAAAAHLLAEHGPAFDFVFIDADHSYEGARADIEAYSPLVCSGGTLAGHDYHWPGVERAVTELLSDVVLGPKSMWSVLR